MIRFIFGQMALRSARGQSAFSLGLMVLEILLAPVRGAGFSLSVKWLCAPRGPEAGLVFSLSWFSRRWRGAGFSFGQMALRSARARGRAGFFFKPVLALVARGCFFLLVKWLCAPRGPERSFIKADCSLLMSKENQKTTSDFDALDPRERGCSPLSDPEGEVEVEKC